MIIDGEGGHVVLHGGEYSDLHHGLRTVASGHRITAVPNHGISVPTHTHTIVREYFQHCPEIWDEQPVKREFVTARR